jgi:hypothetical protein
MTDQDAEKDVKATGGQIIDVTEILQRDGHLPKPERGAPQLVADDDSMEKESAGCLIRSTRDVSDKMMPSIKK